MSKQRLIHIGFPKCMSTALQRDFFSMHPDIYYLGNGGFNNEHGWVDDGVAALLEVGLRYEPELQFDDKWALDVLGEHFDRFDNMPDKKLLCLSSESMSFTMNYDIDPMLKASRLQRLFGENTRILIIIRNQLDLFRSYYFECVRGGYPGFFHEFLEFHYYYRFHSILTNMFYDKILLPHRHLFVTRVSCCSRWNCCCRVRSKHGATSFHS